MKHIYLFLLCIVSPFLCANEARIIGGSEAEPGEYPWLVSLVKQADSGTYEHQCGGTHIGDGFVITAAHCIDVVDTVQFTLGDLEAENVISRYPIAKPANVIVHPNFTLQTYGNDIAIIYVPGAVAESSIQLGSNSATFETVLTIAGWGTTTQPTTPDVALVYPTRLNYANLSLVENDTCARVYGVNSDRVSFVEEKMLCAGLTDVDSCYGDSGGPLFFYETPTTISLTGIVSWGRGCGSADFPGVYTRVENYRSWIENSVVELQAGIRVWVETPIAGMPGDRRTATLNLENVSAETATIDLITLPDDVDQVWTDQCATFTGACSFDLSLTLGNSSLDEMISIDINGSSIVLPLAIEVALSQPSNDFSSFSHLTNVPLYFSGSSYGEQQWTDKIVDGKTVNSPALLFGDFSGTLIGTNESAAVHFHVTGPVDVVFQYSAHSERIFDGYRGYLDGELIPGQEISGVTGYWRYAGFRVPAGEHDITLGYFKNEGTTERADSLALRNLQILPVSYGLPSIDDTFRVFTFEDGSFVTDLTVVNVVAESNRGQRIGSLPVIELLALLALLFISRKKNVISN